MTLHDIDASLCLSLSFLPVPPQEKKSRKLKIWVKIQRARVHNFRDSGSILTKLFHATCHYCERNFVVLNLGLAAPGGLVPGSATPF